MRDSVEIIESIKKALDVTRPYLQEDDGDVEFVRYEEESGVLEIRLLGNCRDCPLSIMTLRAGIERIILKAVPEVKRIEAVN